MSQTPTAPRAPAAQTTTLAVQDADISRAVTAWGPDHFRFLFPAKAESRFEAWKQDLALAIIENKDLRDCLTTESGKISLIRASQKAAKYGLSLNPSMGEAALVVIDGKVDYWPMKNGIIKKVLETRAVEFISSDIIFDNDSFTLKKTAHGDDYDFIPADTNRGKPKAYFAVVLLKSGRSIVEKWPLDQMEAWKLKYAKGLTNPKSTWNKNFDGMAEKTVIKALLRGVHISPEVDNLLDEDDSEEMRNVTEEPKPSDKGTSPGDLAATLAEQAAEPQPTEGEKSGEENGEQEARAVDAEVVDAPQGNVHTGASSSNNGIPPNVNTSSAAVPPKAPTAPASTTPAKPAQKEQERPAVNEDTVCSACKKEFKTGDLSVEHRKSWKCPACGGDLAPNSLF